MNYKDDRIRELDYEVELLSEIVQHLIEGEVELSDELRAFIVKRQDNSAQKIIYDLRMQKMVLLEKVFELTDKLKAMTDAEI